MTFKGLAIGASSEVSSNHRRMAKTLAQGRKPGSGRKPGKGKTLREGRKPGSGRRRRNGDEQDGLVRNTGKTISSRDLEAVDALRELTGNLSQEHQQQLQPAMAETRSPTPTPTPTHMLPELRSPEFLAAVSAAEQHSGMARSSLAQNRLLSHPTATGSGPFSLHDMSPYSIPPQYMHSPPAVASPLMVPLGAGSSPAGSSSDNASSTFTDTNVTGADDPSGSVLIHTTI